jgi:ATP-binding cassette subfamily B protein
VVPPSDPVRDVAVRGSLELRGVGFNYPGAEAPVLSDISFTTVAGRTTAIVGSTGAGKTTLVHLIPRLFDATVGQVLVDGVDVRDLDPDRLWNVIGLVPQRPYLFSVLWLVCRARLATLPNASRLRKRCSGFRAS